METFLSGSLAPPAFLIVVAMQYTRIRYFQ
jgi:hypothetical protein